VTRRELLASAAICGIPLWARSHWDRSRISAITDELGPTADDAANFARDAGMLFVEVRNQPGSNREYASGREADMQAAAAHLANLNVKVSVVHTSLLNFDQAHWDHRMDDLQKALRCAQVMGADKIRILSGTRASDPSSLFQRIADALSEMAAECEKQKVSLILGDAPETNVTTCADLAAILKLVPSKWVGVDWRPAPDGYALLPKKRILNVRVPAVSLTAGRPEFLNWKNILTALEKDGYSGRITLDVGPNSHNAVESARESLDQLVHIVREVS
jgi:sugar phosphate isomerase/epimerase